MWPSTSEYRTQYAHTDLWSLGCASRTGCLAGTTPSCRAAAAAGTLGTTGAARPGDSPQSGPSPATSPTTSCYPDSSGWGTQSPRASTAPPTASLPDSCAPPPARTGASSPSLTAPPCHLPPGRPPPSCAPPPPRSSRGGCSTPTNYR